jgi:outer membrane receptor protein involved in Fe transport
MVLLLAATPALAQVAILDPVTVSATRSPSPQSQVPFTVEVVAGDVFSDGPSLTVDDALRGAADFSLFRRNDSMTANPTSQGVSLRGLGPSGASRSLVLLDGVPLNDPFGGWVPWSCLPVGSVARAEIVPGGGSTAWGNEALAGVIQLFSVEPAAGQGAASLEIGDFGTRSASLSQAYALGPGVLELGGQDFATDGTVLIAAGGRGPVDTDAASRHLSADARWRGTLGAGTAAAFTFRSYDEWRDNGTAYQQNELHLGVGSAEVSGSIGADGTWDATGYVQDQASSQTFSSVNAARTAETPASNQFSVPAMALGLAVTTVWRDLCGQTTLGADTRDVRGETREDFSYSGGAYTEQRFAGGRQTFAGLFVERNQDLAAGLHATAGIRVDRWEDSDGHLRTVLIASEEPLAVTSYPTRTGTEFSPSAGITWQAEPGLKFHVSGQRAFRVPTLNELYRPFRQGTTLTLANPALSTEHADSGEVGAAWKKGPLKVTLTGFAARLDDPVANVTLVKGPGTFAQFGTLPAGGVGQERLNLGRVDTDGVEFGVEGSLTGTVTLDLSVIAEHAEVESAPVAPTLVGNTPPEVPSWNASVGFTWRPSRRLFLSVRLRRTGSQYDDDQNLLPLEAATVVDASLVFGVTRRVDLFLSAENLGNATVETAHSAAGVFSVAPPRIASAGVRAHW